MKILRNSLIVEMGSVLIRCRHWVKIYGSKKGEKPYNSGYHNGKAYNAAWFLEQIGLVSMVWGEVPKKDFVKWNPGWMIHKNAWSINEKKYHLLMDPNLFQDVLRSISSTVEHRPDLLIKDIKKQWLKPN